MKKLKVLLDFIRYSVLAKIGFCRNVIEKLTDNATFPNPDVTLPEASDLVNRLEAANIAAQDGSHIAISAMHDVEAEVDTAFRKLASYVDRVADGHETTILSSGFHASKQPTPIFKSEFAVEHGSYSGSVKLVRKAVEGAKSYIWQHSKDMIPESENDWLACGYSTRADMEVTGLTAGSKYWFRSAVITTVGITDFCAPVMKIVN